MLVFLLPHKNGIIFREVMEVCCFEGNKRFETFARLVAFWWVFVWWRKVR
jgi:hypothetical protein